MFTKVKLMLFTNVNYRKVTLVRTQCKTPMQFSLHGRFTL